MSDFMERARAEAERRWETYSDAAGGADVFDKPSLAVGFLGGARWARGVLLADPTDAEIEELSGLVELAEECQWGDNRTVERIIGAFLAERRWSE